MRNLIPLAIQNDGYNMKYTTLPNTDIKVSKLCLGTMTWGNQNTLEDGFEQMYYAESRGINFFDTAELYAVPASPKTYGATETIIGKWFKESKKRDAIVLASKIAGPGDYTAHIRKTGFSKTALQDALHGSLKRLQTDYIDLYQLHWPERNSNFFGKRDFVHDKNEIWENNFLTILETLQEFIKAGKIKHIGLSNESPWGTMRFLELHRTHNLPKTITVQNPYSLLNRLYEIGLGEISMRENVGLLPYSPLGFGVLSGKYLNNKKPKNGRVTLFPNFSRYSNPESVKATEKYFELAQKHELTLTEMSLAFVTSRPFVTSNIIGATTMEQLKENINSIHTTLSPELLDEINTIHQLHPNPAP